MLSNLKSIVLTLILVITSSALAERADFIKVVANVGGESWTNRDMQVYETVLSEIFKKKKLSEFSKSDYNDFLLSRMSFKEAKNLNLTGDKIVVSEADKKRLANFKSEEIDREVELIAQAQNIIEIKESQHKEATRFNNWFELMKRKYVVRTKTTDLK